MKKLLLSVFVIVVFALYALGLKPRDAALVSALIPLPIPTPVPTTVTTTLASLKKPITTLPHISTPATTPPASPTLIAVLPLSKPSGQYADGQYTGDVADAYYGNVQVQAIITNGKISDVQFLQYPNDRRTSVFINSQAMPYLKQEAIQAQSARVNGVSGATATSGAFRQSLASALSQAKI